MKAVGKLQRQFIITWRQVQFCFRLPFTEVPVSIVRRNDLTRRDEVFVDQNMMMTGAFDNLGFTLHLGPSFDNRIPGTSLNLSPDQLFDLVKETFTKNPAQAIYFQGATMDPLPIIQRIEDALAVPVITSNSAMIWNLLSKLGLKYSVKDHGKLLKEWPACG